MKKFLIPMAVAIVAGSAMTMTNTTAGAAPRVKEGTCFHIVGNNIYNLCGDRERRRRLRQLPPGQDNFRMFNFMPDQRIHGPERGEGRDDGGRGQGRN